MTRKELAKLDASKVRRKPDLYALYKKYVTEDAKHIYATGTLPAGCFGCQFSSIFQKWKNYILFGEEKLNSTTMKTTENKKTYVLSNPAFKVFFKGGVLSNKSTDSQWNEWINHPVDSKLIENRKSIFKTLPASLIVDEDPIEVQDAQILGQTDETPEGDKTQDEEISNQPEPLKEAKDETSEPAKVVKPVETKSTKSTKTSKSTKTTKKSSGLGL